MNVIRWSLPENIPNGNEVTKSVNTFIESEIILWENLSPTPIKHNIIESIDFSSLDTIQPSFISAVDETNYYWMSQTEVTDFLYHASVYSVSMIERVTLYGMDIVRVILN